MGKALAWRPLFRGEEPLLRRHPHLLLLPLLGSLGDHLQGGKLGDPLLPGSRTRSVRPLSPHSISPKIP